MVRDVEALGQRDEVYWQHSASTPPTKRYHAVPAVRLPVPRLAAASPKAMLQLTKRNNNANPYEWTRKDARHAVIL